MYIFVPVFPRKQQSKNECQTKRYTRTGQYYMILGVIEGTACRTSDTEISNNQPQPKTEIVVIPFRTFKDIELSALVSLNLNTANIRAESKQFRRFAPKGVNCSCLFSAWSLGGNQDSE